jgi:hypothetical protein
VGLVDGEDVRTAIRCGRYEEVSTVDLEGRFGSSCYGKEVRQLIGVVAWQDIRL